MTAMQDLKVGNVFCQSNFARYIKVSDTHVFSANTNTLIDVSGTGDWLVQDLGSCKDALANGIKG